MRHKGQERLQLDPVPVTAARKARAQYRQRDPEHARVAFNGLPAAARCSISVEVAFSVGCLASCADLSPQFFQFRREHPHRHLLFHLKKTQCCELPLLLQASSRSRAEDPESEYSALVRVHPAGRGVHRLLRVHAHTSKAHEKFLRGSVKRETFPRHLDKKRAQCFRAASEGFCVHICMSAVGIQIHKPGLGSCIHLFYECVIGAFSDPFRRSGQFLFPLRSLYQWRRGTAVSRRSLSPYHRQYAVEDHAQHS